MKKNVILDPSKFTIKKRGLLRNSLVCTAIIAFMAAGCIKENQAVRLVLPVVTTTAATGVTDSSAVSGGEITSDGGFAISERGVCWSKFSNPSIANVDSMTKDGPGSGLFTSTIKVLASDSTYHIRAYATNSQGTTYGKDLTLHTTPKP